MLNEIEKDPFKFFDYKMANRTTTDNIPFGEIMAFCPVHKFLKKTKGIDSRFVELRLAADDIELKTFTFKDKS